METVFVSFLFVFIGLVFIGIRLNVRIRKIMSYKISQTIFIFLIFLGAFVCFLFEDKLFSKIDVFFYLRKHHINLQDDYIVDYRSVDDYPDYYVDFKLIISEKDKNRIIQMLKNSKDFEVLTDKTKYLHQPIGMSSYRTIIHSYEDSCCFNNEISETYLSSSTYQTVSVSKQGNYLWFELSE